MAAEWRASTWGDEVSLEYGKALRDYDKASGRYRVYGSNGPIGWTDRPLVDGPGVILGRKGAYRGVEYCAQPFFVIDTAYYVVPKAEYDMRWLYYAIKHYKLGEIDDGSPIPSTTRSAVYVRDLDVPPPAEQRAIAAVLGTLDDKIEVNRKQARVLEGIARALFNSWFVDFDPVRRKAAGEPTGLPDEIAAMFPDRLVDSPMGEVPEGWSVLPLPEAFEVNPTRMLRRGEAAPYLDMSNMPTQGHAPAQWVQREAGSGMRFMNGDTLVARITPCLENGKTAFVDFLDDGEVAWGSTEYIVLRPRPPLPAHFAYLMARSEGFRTFAIQAMTGSSGRQRVSASSLAHFLIAVPPGSDDSLAARFGTVVEPLFARMSTAMRQSRALGALRDTLLPKLLSGELRIADAEQIVGRAV